VTDVCAMTSNTLHFIIIRLGLKLQMETYIKEIRLIRLYLMSIWGQCLDWPIRIKFYLHIYTYKCTECK